MKKSYSQPEIVFESFSLCSSIAAGCTTVIEDGSFFDGICYHVPTADKVLFNS